VGAPSRITHRVADGFRPALLQVRRDRHQHPGDATLLLSAGPTARHDARGDISPRPWARRVPTPIGVFHVKGKTTNPGWGVPERIRLEHLRERNDGRKFIKGGDPDNPLGKYRLELDRTLYRIHSTNFPWGIGRLVSHGCTQLYPEDMAHLFPLVPVGTRVEFIYQPVKLGQRDGATWLEAHPDVYRRAGSPSAQANAALRKQSVSVDAERVRAAVASADGVPRVIDRPRWWRWAGL
jgi:L,D-transpeptidase ErfK/SrfK